MYHEEKLRDLDLFRLEKKYLWGHPIADIKHLLGGGSQALQSSVWWEETELVADPARSRKLH